MDFAALQDSVLLKALGSAILNSLWQGFILWLLYKTISSSYKNASAKFKNNLSTILLFFSFAWFLTGFVSKIFNQEDVASITVVPLKIVEESTVHSASVFKEFLIYATSSLPYLSIAYIFLLLFLMARLFAAYRYVYIISNNRLLNPPGELQVFAANVARQMEITKKISVWISYHIDVPATIGFIKPVILIPLASINNLSSQQLEAIILHELSHIKRNDYITNLVISVIETILFFNPFVVLLSNVIKRERENCCDDFVLQYRYDPHSYALALLRLEQSRISKLKLSIGAVSGKKQLLSRIKRITNGEVVSGQFNYGQKLLALLLVTAIICSVAWLSPVEKKSVATKFEEKKIISAQLPKQKIKKEEIKDALTKDLEEVILKRISPKSEQDSLSESDIENLSFAKDQSKENYGFLPAESDSIFSEAMNLKLPHFFFEKNNLKLPPSINIQNFPFSNMDINIDLSKIDMEKLNKGLRQTYKEINAIDWKNIQNEIRQSFSKVKVNNLSTKEQAELYAEKAKALSKIMEDQHQLNSKAFIENFQKEPLFQDSMRRQEIAFIYENDKKIQQLYKSIQTQNEKKLKGNFYFNYRLNTAPDNNVEITEDVHEKNKPLTSGTKNIKISIKHIPIPGGVINEKKVIQFSFDKETKNSGSENNIIDVEFNK